MAGSVRTVVFPVAGFGTRFLPASKSVAKELLPVLDKPLLQYAVDEAVEAGAKTLVFVVNRHKHAIADYFDSAPELEQRLAESGKQEMLDAVRSTLPRGVQAIFVTQQEARGLGHAIACAEPVVGDQPFGVILPDDLIHCEGQGALGQLIDASDGGRSAVVAVEDVPREDTGRYGIVDVDGATAATAPIRQLVEKPDPADAPSTLGIVGRYVLPGRIFELLRSTRPGSGGEIQITDAIKSLIPHTTVLAHRFEGSRFDCGNKLGMFKASLFLALRDPELAPSAHDMLGQARAGQPS